MNREAWSSAAQQIQQAIVDVLARWAHCLSERTADCGKTAERTANTHEAVAELAADRIRRPSGAGSAVPNRRTEAAPQPVTKDPIGRLPPDYLRLDPGDPGHAVVGPVSESDGRGIARAHVLATRVAFRDLPGAAEHLDDFLLSSLGPRMIAQWDRQARSAEPGLLVARTADDGIAGFILTSTRESGVGDLHAWYVHPNWHGRGVGRALIEAALERWGNVDVHTQTTAGTAAVDRYLRHGFEIVGESDTPPPLAAAGLLAPQVLLKRSATAE